MAAVSEGPLPFDATPEEEYGPTDAIVFFGICLVLGIASRHIFRGTRVPYTVALLVIGIGLGGLEYGTSHRLGKVGAGIRLWASINPDLLLAVFLPALLFESSFLMEVHQIKGQEERNLLPFDGKSNKESQIQVGDKCDSR